MDNLTAIHWLSIVRLAKQGNEEAQETLRQQNELRAENNLPTVEEELIQMAQKG